MSKSKIILFLWLFIAMVAFFSCGDVNEPDHNFDTLPEQDIDIDHLSFVKVSVRKLNYGYGDFMWISRFPITECTLGDTIGLSCGIYALRDGMRTYEDEDLPKSVTVKITSFAGNIEFVKLFDNPYVSYSMEFPPPSRNYVSRYSKLKYTITNKMALNSQDRDLLTAEIKGKNQTVKATLKYRSK